MKRDFSVILCELDEKTPIKMVKDAKDVSITGEDDADPGNLTMSHVVAQALILAKPDGANLKETVARYHLAKKAYEGGVQELRGEDLELIKKAVATVFTTLVIGQTYDWCEKDFKEPDPLPFPLDSESPS